MSNEELAARLRAWATELEVGPEVARADWSIVSDHTELRRYGRLAGYDLLGHYHNLSFYLPYTAPTPPCCRCGLTEGHAPTCPEVE